MWRGAGHVWERRARLGPLILAVLMPCLKQTRAVFVKPKGNQQAESVDDTVGEILECFKTKLPAQHLCGNVSMVKKI